MTTVNALLGSCLSERLVLGPPLSCGCRTAADVAGVLRSYNSTLTKEAASALRALAACLQAAEKVRAARECGTPHTDRA